MDESPLDLVAYSCNELNEALTTSNVEKDTLILKHIKKMWQTVQPIDDFKKNLDWVNVSTTISLVQHCWNKVVVLDFFTYCCINCYHVLPDLRKLEQLYSPSEGVAVIGVHSAKFDNEKVMESVTDAVKRYDIRHPVVNDGESDTWKKLGIRCWPTLLVLGPHNKPIYVFTGEGHGHDLIRVISIAIKHFGKLCELPFPLSQDHKLLAKVHNKLHYPGKVSLNPFYKASSSGEPYIAISDTSNHRVVVADCSGRVLHCIGKMEAGFCDGSFDEALLDSPQGVCWLSRRVLAICDTGNHALRTAHLDERNVELLAGTGKQTASGDMGGKCLGLQALSSPWDLVLYTTADMDMSFRPPTSILGPAIGGAGAPPPPPAPPRKDTSPADDARRVLLIASAGCHQIWALFLDTTVWWKYKTYNEGVCVAIAGSGREECRNSSYPGASGFAQPSGLAVRRSPPELFVADSESSAVRKIALSTGQVSSVAGGDRNPTNLFAYGSADGTNFDAKFQHPLGITYSEITKLIYVADSYNHIIRSVDPVTCRVTTLHFKYVDTDEIITFKEPSGIAVTNDGKYLYVADTNDHNIKVLNLAKGTGEIFDLNFPEAVEKCDDKLEVIESNYDFELCSGKFSTFVVDMLIEKGKNIHFTPDAPQSWNAVVREKADLKEATADCVFAENITNGKNLPGSFAFKGKSEIIDDKKQYILDVCFKLYLCEGDVCFTKEFIFRNYVRFIDTEVENIFKIKGLIKGDKNVIFKIDNNV